MNSFAKANHIASRRPLCSTRTNKWFLGKIASSPLPSNAFHLTLIYLRSFSLYIISSPLPHHFHNDNIGHTVLQNELIDWWSIAKNIPDRYCHRIYSRFFFRLFFLHLISRVGRRHLFWFSSLWPDTFGHSCCASVMPATLSLILQFSTSGTGIVYMSFESYRGSMIRSQSPLPKSVDCWVIKASPVERPRFRLSASDVCKYECSIGRQLAMGRTRCGSIIRHHILKCAKSGEWCHKSHKKDQVQLLKIEKRTTKSIECLALSVRRQLIFRTMLPTPNINIQLKLIRRYLVVHFGGQFVLNFSSLI